MADEPSDLGAGLRRLAGVAVSQETSSQITSQAELPIVVGDAESTTMVLTDAKSRKILLDGEAADRIMVESALVTQYFSKHIPAMGKEIFLDAKGVDRIRMETTTVTHYCSKHLPCSVGSILSDAEVVDRIGSPSTPTSISTGTAVKSLLEMKDVKKVLPFQEVTPLDESDSEMDSSPTKQTQQEMLTELDNVNSFDSSKVPWVTQPDTLMSLPTKVLSSS